MENLFHEDFSYQYYEANRYLMPKHNLNGIEYEGMCTGGYTKLYTLPGKIYWLIQNSENHLTPDWKFHVSVRDSDVKTAWNLVARIFIGMGCRSGMKVKYLKENPQTVRGREITVYIPIYVKKYDLSEIGNDIGFNSSIQQDEDFWYQLFDKIEETLKANNITSNGCAKGDLPLGEYVSLRNEAFVTIGREECYPPDNYGWNAAKHELPFDIKRFQRKKESILSGRIGNLVVFMSIMVFIVSIYVLKQ